MANTPDSELKYQEFWSRMEKNSRLVQRMPVWMKGSPVNRRINISTKGIDARVNVKAAPSANR